MPANESVINTVIKEKSFFTINNCRKYNHVITFNVVFDGPETIILTIKNTLSHKNFLFSIFFLNWLMINPAAGTLLIANPHLNDPNFLRTVVFLCDHSSEGSFGLVINRKVNYTIDELVPELGDFKLPVYEGGPVELNTLHFLHQYPNEISGGKEVIPGVYWGGNFEELVALINSRTINNDKIRFYLGYSGWGEGQLDMEMDEKTWIVADATKRLLFHPSDREVWKDSLLHLGGEYELIINAPIDPHLN